MSIIYVDAQNGNDTTGDGTSGNPYKSFGKSYSMTSAGDTIDLSGVFDWAATDNCTSSVTGFTLTKDIILQGQDGVLTKIDCCADRRAFTMGNYNTSMSNLEIYNGWNPYGQRSPIIDLYSTTTAGKGTYINKCWLHNCSAGTNADGIDTELSLFRTYNNTKFTMENSTLSNCYARYMIIYNGSGANTEWKNCTITGVTMGYYTIYNPGGTMGIINCTIYNNSDHVVRMTSGTVSIKNSILHNTDSNIFNITGGTLNVDYTFVDATMMGALPVVDGIDNNIVQDGLDGSIGSLDQWSSTYGVPTLKLLAGHPAIGTGDTADYNGFTIPTFDARGFTRDGSMDMGAYAFNGTVPPTAPTITLNNSSIQTLMINTLITPITFTSDVSVTTWAVGPTLPTGLSIDASTGTITGTPTVIDIVPVQYTICGENNIGNDTASITLSVVDSYIVDLSGDTGYTVSDLSAINHLTVSGSGMIDISLYLPDNTPERRRHLVDMILSRSQNSSKSHFKTPRMSLGLTSNYTKNVIRVYQKGWTIDLNDLSGDEGAYCTINAEGEICTFMNVGGNGNTAVFTANGDSTYGITYNGVDVGTGNDGDELAIGGVAFYLGSVGTEGTAGDSICFTGDAMVMTNKGEIPIRDIKVGQQILGGDGKEYPVNHHIRVVNASPYLIRIEKGTFGNNTPNRDTTITPEHKILVDIDQKGLMWYKAEDLLHINGVSVIYPNVYTYVYHISVKNGEIMIVNGLCAETINPQNVNIQTRECNRVDLIVS